MNRIIISISIVIGELAIAQTKTNGIFAEYSCPKDKICPITSITLHGNELALNESDIILKGNVTYTMENMGNLTFIDPVLGFTTIIFEAVDNKYLHLKKSANNDDFILERTSTKIDFKKNL